MANFLTSSPIIQDLVLPFLLVFLLVFAILQKSKIFGEGKKQIDALISFVIAGLFLAFSKYVSWLKDFSIVLVVSIFIIFIFLLIWGFVWGDSSGDSLKDAKGLKWVIGIIFLIIIVVAALNITGYIDVIKTSSSLISNIIFIVLIIGAIAVVLNSGKKEDKK